MPTDLPPRRERSNADETGRALGMLATFGVFVMVGLGCVWLMAYTAARAVKTALGL